ncbi:MAG: MlaA family lipoprotein [Pseudomonadota bacterium]
MMHRTLIGLLVGVGIALNASAQQEPETSGDSLPGDVDPQKVADSSVYDDRDPWESFNRSIFAFNEVVDSNVARPVARGYNRVTPEPVNDGVTNFFSNISEPGNVLNSLLQGKGEAALISTGRFIFNTTFGLLGLVDVASYMELPEQDEDFGQTFGYWGVDTGPFLMLPFLGPSTVRDSAGMGVDYAVPDLMDEIETPERYYLYGLYGIDLRASLLRYEDQITGDRYTFMRNAYLQRRQYQVNDGKVEDDPFADDDEDMMLDDF